MSTLHNKFKIDLQIKSLQTKNVIYKFTNLINNKIYFGQTTLTLYQRLHMYLREIQNPKDNRLIIRALRKYGTNNFKIEIVKECNTIEDLNILEEQSIDENQSMNNKIGYNLQPGGSNKKVHEDTKVILREKCSGWTHTEKAKQIISDHSRGENHNCAILKDQNIRDIILDTLSNKYKTLDDVAIVYNIHRDTIYKIIIGKLWTHITSEFSKSDLEKVQKILLKEKHNRLSDSVIQQIKDLKSKGINTVKIAKTLNISIGSAYKY